MSVDIVIRFWRALVTAIRSVFGRSSVGEGLALGWSSDRNFPVS